MREITSKTNDLVKLDTTLLTKKGRDKEGLFIIEGLKLIAEAISAGYEIVRIYVDKNSIHKYQSQLDCWRNIDIISTTEDIIQKITDAKTSQGIIAVSKKTCKRRKNTFERALILENLQDPKNVGALLRTASATNFIDVYLVNSACPYGAKSVRASMSGIFKVNLHFTSLEQAISELNGYEVLCGDMNGEDLFSAKLSSKKVAVAVGNEGNGVSDELVRLSTKTVTIPMDNALESLNVAVSGSILMYEIKRIK